ITRPCEPLTRHKWVISMIRKPLCFSSTAMSHITRSFKPTNSCSSSISHRARMKQVNINTPEYWDRVYRGEWESGQATGENYSRDYGPIHDAIIRLIPDGSTVLDIACGPGLLCRKIKQ